MPRGKTEEKIGIVWVLGQEPVPKPGEEELPARYPRIKITTTTFLDIFLFSYPWVQAWKLQFYISLSWHSVAHIFGLSWQSLEDVFETEKGHDS